MNHQQEWVSSQNDASFSRPQNSRHRRPRKPRLQEVLGHARSLHLQVIIHFASSLCAGTRRPETRHTAPFRGSHCLALVRCIPLSGSHIFMKAPCSHVQWSGRANAWSASYVLPFLPCHAVYHRSQRSYSSMLARLSSRSSHFVVYWVHIRQHCSPSSRAVVLLASCPASISPTYTETG